MALLLGAAGPAPMVLTVMAVPFNAPRPQTSTAYEPAPVPNVEASAPTGRVDPAKPEFGPTVFSASKKQSFRGDGFVANSSEQVAEERNYRPGGGFSLKMPLQ